MLSFVLTCVLISLVMCLRSPCSWPLSTAVSVARRDAVQGVSTPCSVAENAEFTSVAIEGDWEQRDGGIYRVPRSGGSPQLLYGELVSPHGLLIHDHDLYWIDANSGPKTSTQIFRAPKDGRGPAVPIYMGGGLPEPIVDGSGIVTDGRYLYTTDEVEGRVCRLNFDGSEIRELGRRWSSRPGNRFFGEHHSGLALSGGTLFIADAGSTEIGMPPQIVTIPSEGGSFHTLWSGAPLFKPWAIAVRGARVFVADPGAHTVWALPESGGKPVAVLRGLPVASTCGLVTSSNGLTLVDSAHDRQPAAVYQLNTNSAAGLSLAGVAVWLTIVAGILAAGIRVPVVRRSAIRAARKLLRWSVGTP